MWAIYPVREIPLARGQNIPYFCCCFPFRLLYIVEYILEQCYIVLCSVRVKVTERFSPYKIPLSKGFHNKTLAK